MFPFAILDSLALSPALLLRAFSDVYEGQEIPWKGDFLFARVVICRRNHNFFIDDSFNQALNK